MGPSYHCYRNGAPKPEGRILIGRAHAVPIRTRDVLFAEITKIVTNPATFIFLAISFLANITLAGIDALQLGFYTEGANQPRTISSFGVVMFAPVYAFAVIAVVSAASEYSSGQIRVTLTASPARKRLIYSKVAAVAVVILFAALIAVAPSRALIGIANGSSGWDICLQIILWMAVYCGMSLIAYGLAGLFRGVVAPLAIMISLPMLVATGILQWPQGIRFLPDQASLSLLGTPAYEVTEISPAAGGLVLLLWSQLLIVAYSITFVLRDV